MKILVAEDDLTMRHLMATILRRHGIEATVVGNGFGVLEAWRRERWDCILMDIQMPMMDGLTATRNIRERESETGGHTIIIAVTAFASGSDRARCLECGMDDYISKPVDVTVLLNLMEKHSKELPGRPQG